MPVSYCYGCGCYKCGVCGACHACDMNKFAKITSKTQKGKGILFLNKVEDEATITVNGIVQKGDTIPTCPQIWTHELFARPCPTIPRHGFVDSRRIKSFGELQKVWDETIAADPDGEVLICEPIAATYNLIWTPKLLTVGEGFDGATSGRDTISMPLAGIVPKWLKEAKAERTGIAADQWPYVEVVSQDPYRGGNSFLTQLRAGPPLSTLTSNFIPAPIEVGRVIKVNGESLLEWEAMAKGMDPKVDVVYHPGGSVLDHYTVHARTFGITTILEGTEPQVGDLLIPEVEVEELDPQAVLRGIVLGGTVKIVKSNRAHMASSATTLMLTGLYNSGAMTGANGMWLGAAVSLMLRLGSTALSGEARHAKTHSSKGSRESVYSRMFDRPLGNHRGRLIELIRILRYAFPTGPTGVGGEKWAKCGAVLIPLFNGIRDLARDPTVENVNKLIRALNIAVDQAHNGGWWLNKFVGHETFKEVQEGVISTVSNAGEAIYLLGQLAKTADQAQIDKAIAAIAKWPVTVFTPPRVIGAAMQPESVVQDALGVQIEINHRSIKEKYRNVTIPVKGLINKLLKGWISNLYVTETPRGFGLELRSGELDPVVIYEEDDLTNVQAGETSKHE